MTLGQKVVLGVSVPVAFGPIVGLPGWIFGVWMIVVFILMGVFGPRDRS